MARGGADHHPHDRLRHVAMLDATAHTIHRFVLCLTLRVLRCGSRRETNRVPSAALEGAGVLQDRFKNPAKPALLLLFDNPGSC